MAKDTKTPEEKAQEKHAEKRTAMQLFLEDKSYQKLEHDVGIVRAKSVQHAKWEAQLEAARIVMGATHKDLELIGSARDRLNPPKTDDAARQLAAPKKKSRKSAKTQRVIDMTPEVKDLSPNT
jgi:hypothetical protein